MKRVNIHLAILSVAVLLVACDRAESPAAPTLLRPTENMVIAQNDPGIGCEFHPARGFGFRVVFDWTDSASPEGISRYHLIVQQRNAPIPAVDTYVVDSTYTDLNCNGYVAERHSEDWEWRVRAEDNLGNMSPWSEAGLFQFAPCRLADGTPCTAPP
jgi:hypothetical protein